jgi:hypothetical protein
VYLAKLSASNGDKSFIIFVVRNDGGTEPILFQTSVTTYQAYNAWGGVSLYTNNTNGTAYKYAHATKVSFDRPYDPLDGNGAGHFFLYEYPFIRWAESQGYNVSYITDVDTATNVNPLTNHRVYLSVGHDEYWSHSMRDNVTNAIAHGVNAAFFSANTSYWQIRFEPNAAGAPNRVEVGYKDFATSTSAPGPDPMWNVNNSAVTTNWRSDPVNLPENSFIGVMYQDQVNKDYAYVVQNASNWVYAGTGFTNGTSIPGIVGYEYDKVWNNGFSPPGETILSNSPVVGCCEGSGNSDSNSTVYTAPSGAQVFAAGTIQWSWGLDNYSSDGQYVNAGIQRTTANILNAFSLGGGTPAPAVSLSPTSVSFGSQLVGSTSAAQSVTLTNSGNAALSISNIAVGGTNASDFAQSNSCPASLAAGASCTISATFTPSATGTRTASVQVTDSASDSPQSVGLSGTGASAGPTVSLSPSSLSFGSQLVGSTSAAQSVTLTNSGNAGLSISNIALGGTNAGDFAQTNTCPSGSTTLAAGASCSISVTFAPSAAGTRSASLQITDNASGSPQSVALSGTGSAPGVTLSPSSLSFGSQVVGKASAAQSVTLTNSGNAALSISNIAMGGTNAGDFAQTNTCPSGSTTLAAGASCSISVTFTPSATGARSAGVQVADNANGSPQTVALSGTGVIAGTVALDKTLGQLAQNASASTIKLTTSAAAVTGSRVFVFVDWWSASGTLSSLSGGGLTWSVDGQVKDSTGYHTAIASAGATNGLAAGSVLTATFSQSVLSGLISAASFTGIAPSSPLDVSSANLQDGVRAWTGSVTTTNANDLVLGWSGIDKNTTNTAASPNIKLFDFGNGPFGESATAEYQIVTATGGKTVNGSWGSASGATANSTVVVAYKSG